MCRGGLTLFLLLSNLAVNYESGPKYTYLFGPYPLTFCGLNSQLYILEDSNFDFRYVRLCDLDIPRENG